MKSKYIFILSVSLCLVISVSVYLLNVGCNDKKTSDQKTVVVKMYELTADPKTTYDNLVGTIIFTDSSSLNFSDGKNSSGLQILTQLQLKDVSPGSYGFHIHNNPSCLPDTKDGNLVLGLAAGGHLDPNNTGKHLGPYDSNGHLGDLPLLVVSDNGMAVNTVVAPRLKLSDIINHSVMIHAGGDNFSDSPERLGGGGARKYCGVIANKE